MNLVFGSLFLFILISPGLLFRFSYLQGSYAKLAFKVSAVDEILWALIPALILHLNAIWWIENVVNTPVNLDVIYQLVTAKDTDLTIVKQSLLSFLFYITILIGLGILFGLLTRLTVRKLRLDLHWKFLRFGNEWYYLLSGEMLNVEERTQGQTWLADSFGFLKNSLQPKVQVELIQIDAVVKSSEGDLIYSGILKDYFLSKDNGLDRIYLTNVYRRVFKNDLDDDDRNPGFMARDTDERYYAMPGDFFVLTYDKIQNLNITYYLQAEVNNELQPEQES